MVPRCSLDWTVSVRCLPCCWRSCLSTRRHDCDVVDCEVGFASPCCLATDEVVRIFRSVALRSSARHAPAMTVRLDALLPWHASSPSTTQHPAFDAIGVLAWPDRGAGRRRDRTSRHGRTIDLADGVELPRLPRCARAHRGLRASACASSTCRRPRSRSLDELYGAVGRLASSLPEGALVVGGATTRTSSVARTRRASAWTRWPVGARSGCSTPLGTCASSTQRPFARRCRPRRGDRRRARRPRRGR